MLEGEAEYIEAKKFHEQGNYSDALKNLQISIDKGYNSAKRSLGYYFLNGTAVERDEQKGFDLLKEAAIGGDSAAQYFIASKYYNGVFVEKDYKEAIKWAKCASEQDEEYAHLLLYYCYTDGTGVEVNEEKALDYLKMAALHGNSYAQHKLLKGSFPDNGFERFDEFLYNAYANLNMLMYAFKSKLTKFNQQCYMIRAKSFKAYKEGRWNIHDLLENNIDKMRSGNFCWYCGTKVKSKDELTIEHIFPRSKGGDNDMNNIVLVCKHCNSSKGDMDVLEWFVNVRKEFPPTYIIVHHLKEINLYATINNLMDKSSLELDKMKLPFNWRFIPTSYKLYNGEEE